MMNVTSISDLHGYLNFDVPKCDILTISGDICPVFMSHGSATQHKWLQEVFLPWCNQLIKNKITRYVVFIAGNHDMYFQNAYLKNASLIFNMGENIHYLYNSMIEIEGIKIYGTPWTALFGNWGFMGNEHKLEEVFSKIPEGMDIVITHGPPYGYCDKIEEYKIINISPSNNDEHLGSKVLTKHLERAQPKWCIFGHIHSGSHNVEFLGQTKCINVSLLGENYSIAYKPFNFNIGE